MNAFHSSKGGDEKADNINVSASTSNSHTSGRYGIGLTLCILHAQRCVPNSRVCITSVSEKSKYRTRAIFEVDEQGDSVDCVQEEVTPVSLLSSKDNASATENESGTCVSLLVPVSNNDLGITVVRFVRSSLLHRHTFHIYIVLITLLFLKHC